jgi:hypothetical protein
VTLSLNPDNFRNPGLAKKILKYEDNESVRGTGNQTGLSVETQKERTLKNNGNSKQIRESNSNNKPEKGNNNKNDDESDGKSNGKKN